MGVEGRGEMREKERRKVCVNPERHPRAVR
jgi:hypothetical protein